MSQPPLAISIERRERHPYRSLQAELLFQSFRDALVETGEIFTTVREAVEKAEHAGLQNRTGRVGS